MSKPAVSPPARATPNLPAHLVWLVVFYFIASLVHFSHNAEYIALYPNMPAWLSRENVYVAWLAVCAVGAASAVLWLSAWRRVAVAGLALYGVLGLGGLAHYTLALCSEHTLMMNATIWFEALSGVALAGASIWYLGQRARRQGAPF